MDGSAGVIDAPFGVQPIDPHHPHPRAVAACGKRLGQRLTGGDLFVGGDGIFEVENHRVAGQPPRFVEGAGLGAGDVENGTQRAGCGGHVRLLGQGGALTA